MATIPILFPHVALAPVRGSHGSSRRASVVASASSSSQAWWAPLFGFQTNPDYVGDGEIETPTESVLGRVRFSPGCFTEEKARKLRLKTAEGIAFHDVMYHSAIASRLATDLSGRSQRNAKHA